jgi:hypothetical protein
MFCLTEFLGISYCRSSRHASFITCVWRSVLFVTRLTRSEIFISLVSPHLIFVNDQERKNRKQIRSVISEIIFICLSFYWRSVDEYKLTYECKTTLLCRFLSSVIYRHVVCWKATDVSEEHIASNFSVERITQARNQPEAGRLWLLTVSCWFFVWFILRPWRWGQHVPPKRRLTIRGLHGVLSQKIVLFVTTAVET